MLQRYVPSCFVIYITILFLTIPLSPPTFTLFPYTTLFRSAAAAARAVSIVGLPNEQSGYLPMTTYSAVTARRPDLDRKSTRLNSSHGYISYAVFCLKKKKDY